MHEYEFRLVVCSPDSFLPLLSALGLSTKKSLVYYGKPHFRLRNGVLETKRVQSTQAVYHDGLWFRWVHSVETTVSNWNRATRNTFLHVTANFQNSFRAELRDVARIDDQAQLYTFRDAAGYRLVFEWEPPAAAKDLLGALSAYRRIYSAMRPFSLPLSHAEENHPVRKPVLTLDSIPEGCLYAHKLDGTFGIVISYPDHIKEKWEDYECRVRRNVTLGDRLVFAAERMDSGEVFLLDVYQVQGHNTASWCRRAILTEFLPALDMIPGYFTQTYVADREQLRPIPHVKVDGIICHDVEKDIIYKFKKEHSLDLVYTDGYFNLPNGRIKCDTEGLENGSVYEISVLDGSVIRKRIDRFKGNTPEQIASILKRGNLEILNMPKKKCVKRLKK